VALGKEGKKQKDERKSTREGNNTNEGIRENSKKAIERKIKVENSKTQ
jgi:hypothetical protein